MSVNDSGDAHLTVTFHQNTPHQKATAPPQEEITQIVVHEDEQQLVGETPNHQEASATHYRPATNESSYAKLMEMDLTANQRNEEKNARYTFLLSLLLGIILGFTFLPLSCLPFMMTFKFRESTNPRVRRYGVWGFWLFCVTAIIGTCLILSLIIVGLVYRMKRVSH